jgi:hypothetical protein
MICGGGVKRVGIQLICYAIRKEFARNTEEEEVITCDVASPMYVEFLKFINHILFYFIIGVG